MVVGGAELFKLSLAGSWGYGEFHLLKIHIVVLGMGKALFADVAFPANRMAVLYGFLNMKHQLVERKIEKLVVHHIVGYFKGEVLAVRVMGKTGE